MKIKAVAVEDATRNEYPFDAAGWFEKATDEDVLRTLRMGVLRFYKNWEVGGTWWMLDIAVDAVKTGLFPELAEMIRNLKSGADMEAYMDRQDIEDAVRQHRPHLVNSIQAPWRR